MLRGPNLLIHSDWIIWADEVSMHGKQQIIGNDYYGFNEITLDIIVKFHLLQ